MVKFELFWLLNALLNWLLSGFLMVLSSFLWVWVGLGGFGWVWRRVEVVECVWVCLGVFGC